MYIYYQIMLNLCKKHTKSMLQNTLLKLHDADLQFLKLVILAYKQTVHRRVIRWQVSS